LPGFRLRIAQRFHVFTELFDFLLRRVGPNQRRHQEERADEEQIEGFLFDHEEPPEDLANLFSRIDRNFISHFDGCAFVERGECAQRAVPFDTLELKSAYLYWRVGFPPDHSAEIAGSQANICTSIHVYIY